MNTLSANDIVWLLIAVQLIVIFFQAAVIRGKNHRIRELTARKPRAKPKREYLREKERRSIWDL